MKVLGTRCSAYLSAAVLAAGAIVIATIAPQSPRTPSLAFLVAAIALPANAQPSAITANRWERYINTRYGVIIDYPADLFTAEAPPPDNAGRNFVAADSKARFHIYSHANTFDFAIYELQAADALEIGDAAAEKQSGDDWYQVVAVKDNDTIIRRVLLSEGGALVHRLEIAFPTAAATAFAPIVERMIRSYRVDPEIPEKAAGAAGPAASAAGSPPAWQRFDSIALGLRIPGYRGKAGMSAEVPASWTKAEMPEPNVIEFDGPEATGENELYVLFHAERRRSGATLASEARALKARLARNADNFRVLDERTAQIALRPAIVLTLQYAGSDSPALLRRDIAIIDAGEILYFVQFGAPASRYQASRHVFTHVVDTIGFAQ